MTKIEPARGERHQGGVLDILLRVSSTLAAERDLQTIAQEVTDAGREITGAAICAFLENITNAPGEEYHPYARSGAPTEAFASLLVAHDAELRARLFEGRRSIRSTDVPGIAQHEGHLELRSYLAVPVVSRTGGVLGGLFVVHAAANFFSPEAETMLAGVAAIAAMTIDNVHLTAAAQREVLERAQTEAALRASEERLRTLAESLPHLVWTCRPDGWCDYLSRQWVEYTGRPEHDQLGSGWADHLHPGDRDRVQAEWAASTVRGDVFDVEFRIRRADGIYRWFKTRAVPLRDGEGKIVKWFGSNTDFDDFKRGQERLNAQLARLNLLDRTTSAIGERMDLQSIFRVVLRSLEDNLPIDLGCACLHVEGNSALTIVCIGPGSQSLAQQMALSEFARVPIDENGLARCIRGELVYEPDIAESAFAFPARLARVGLRSLVIAPLSVNSKVFGVMIAARRAPSGFSSGDCEFLRQLTQHVALAAHQAQLYDSLQNAYNDLRQSQQTVMQHERLRVLGQMASGVAHDINNALSPASLYVESILERDSELSAGLRENLVVVQHAIESVTQTVARMKQFYRPRDVPLSRETVDVNRIAEQAIDLTRARWSDMPQERGIVIRLSARLDASLPQVTADESDVRDAITNLILNAIDAMPEGGTLVVRSSTGARASSAQAGGGAATHVNLEVSDTGVGMSETVRSRCLEPFYTTKGERGTGLGLAMVYGMVQRHGAELEIDSELGVGTTVRVAFPIAEAGATGEPRAPRHLKRGLRILLIDDDLVLLKSLRDTLEHDGNVVTIAEGGQAGIDAFILALKSERRFALVFTDLGMPHVDGRTVAVAIKSRSPATPIVMLTGWGHRLQAENDLPEHVDLVLSKPPKLTELRAAISELVRD